MAMNEKLVVPINFAVSSVTGSANTIATAQNLLNDRLGRVAYVDAATVIVLDAGSMVSVDTAAILASNSAGGGIAFAVQGFATRANAIANVNEISSTGAVSTWASAEAGRRLHRQGLGYLNGNPARFFRVTFSSDLTIGRLVIGQSFTAADTMDIGYSFKVVDLGERRRATNSLVNNTLRGKVLEYSWVWSWMSEQEARGALLDLLAYAGTTRDILCILNPDAADLHNVIGYGSLVEEVEGVNVAGGNVDSAYEAKFRLQSRLLLNL